MSKITFNNASNPFFRALKEKVDNYFQANRLHACGNTKLYLKSIFQISTAITFYVLLVFYTPIPVVSIIICFLFGVNLAVLGFNVMHEGGHQSFSEHRWLNNVSAYFLNAMGGNSHFWKIKHNFNHHTYTNIDGSDFDLNVGPLMRLHENQPKYWFHKFQHWYWIVLYGISYIGWIFFQDFQKYFTGKISPEAEARTMVRREHIIFWITKILYAIVYLAIPILMVGFAKFIIGFLIIAFACGISMSIVFQVAHMVGDTQFPVPDERSNKIDQEWAIHQINTTANFANKNKLVCWLVGGLNFQIEHHLFPKISHIHYPKISLLVKETCKEFNINYIEYASVAKAFQAHHSHIKKLGNL